MDDDLKDGLKRGFGITVAVIPFGLLFGALAVANGMSPWEATLMSALIYGGASQMVGLELFGQNIAPWLIVLSIFAVNFRHVLYSAAIGRRLAHFSIRQKGIAFFLLTDPQYAETERRLETGQRPGFAWYLALALPVYIGWIVESFIGAQFGKLITNPKALGIDFLLPIYFIGIVMGFRKRQLWLPVTIASAVGAVIAYRTVGSPWHVSIGALAGVLLAAAWPLTPMDEAVRNEPLP